ncbi:Fanconi anemia core complex-associated protein 24 isoform X2 [Cherax quadricarinatus]|nr:Fanconi anemia core complex-associated protein 24-like [Cherax quadricarinatus]XP_053647567.1 Fanconi anemia core complex-associated protein 24-like [Cherax quadricarinatus]XP_053647568.1 Fanconi anemia core complex-associated protein 24-like [Cherax quadricarinatus]XP_053647569.1 Fanconi anemia core complex-associated protein 24-like [Cherax quadricarinatus]XP_053647570.1 Fanconi anemia core complex-associated protein 24-like [Cherax quadricarinatus]XP_053647571.1 Fanconi anemia core compl
MSVVSQSAPINNHVVPPGHILMSKCWRGTQLAGHLSKLIPIHYSDGLGIVDFCPSQDAALIFISEADIISGSSYKERVIKFRKVNGFLRGIVMAQNTLTSDEFYKLQRFVCVEIGLAILPVQTIEEAAQLLANLVMCEAKFNSNPFRMKPKTASSPDADLLKTTAMIPGLGDKRVRKILQHFGSLKELANATQETLEEVVGAATASSVYNFFHQSFLL